MLSLHYWVTGLGNVLVEERFILPKEMVMNLIKAIYLS